MDTQAMSCFRIDMTFHTLHLAMVSSSTAHNRVMFRQRESISG